jgi:hypothetical protein
MRPIFARRLGPLAIASLAIGLLVVAVLLTHSFRQRQIALQLRQHVFCDQIKPGMEQSEVEAILQTYGNFTESTSRFAGDFSVVYVAFNDPDVHKSFGNQPIILAFDQGRFVRATVPALSDTYPPICP